MTSTLSDFGFHECEGGVCQVQPRTTPEEVEIRYLSFVGRDRLRGRKDFQTGNLIFWQRVGLPLARVMGLEFGLRQISPVMGRWL